MAAGRLNGTESAQLQIKHAHWSPTTQPRAMVDPAPKASLLDYGSSSIDDALRSWMADPMTNLGISSELR